MLGKQQVPAMAKQKKASSSQEFVPESVGHMLGVARESAGMAKAQVAESLHIKPHLVDAMEEDRFDQLPGGTYTLAYLKGYAKLLEIEPKLVEQRYLEQTGREQAQPRQKFYSPESMEEDASEPQTLLILASLGLFFLLSVGWYIYRGQAEEMKPATLDAPHITLPDEMKPRSVLEQAKESEAEGTEDAAMIGPPMPSTGKEVDYTGQTTDTQEEGRSSRQGEKDGRAPAAKSPAEETLPWLQ